MSGLILPARHLVWIPQAESGRFRGLPDQAVPSWGTQGASQGQQRPPERYAA